MRGLAQSLNRVASMVTRPIRMWIAESPSTRDYQLILHLCRTRGLRQFLSGNHYDESFYADHVRLRKGYSKLADLVFDWATPKSACDFGCGNGFLLYYLSKKGVAVSGVEGSTAAFKFMEEEVKSNVFVKDLSEAIDVGKHELVISTEVAEHLPKRVAPVFVDNLARTATKKIVFTAARPGQWGDGHINCQPKQFWIELFATRGWSFDQVSTKTFRESVRNSPDVCETLPWMTENFMLFIPRG